MFITERAVLRMSDEGFVVTEIAPGIRLREDVLDQIGFEVEVLPDLPTMDPRIFREGCMGLLDTLHADQLSTPPDASNNEVAQA